MFTYQLKSYLLTWYTYYTLRKTRPEYFWGKSLLSLKFWTVIILYFSVSYYCFLWRKYKDQLFQILTSVNRNSYLSSIYLPIYNYIYLHLYLWTYLQISLNLWLMCALIMSCLYTIISFFLGICSLNWCIGLNQAHHYPSAGLDTPI